MRRIHAARKRSVQQEGVTGYILVGRHCCQDCHEGACTKVNAKQPATQPYVSMQTNDTITTAQEPA